MGQVANIRIIFFGDKTGTITMSIGGKSDSVSITWKTIDNTVYMYNDDSPEILEASLVNDNTLTINQSGQIFTLTKQ